MAGAAIGRLAERPDVIVLDVGGTSADVSLSRRGRPLIRPEWNIEFNIVISFPSVDVTAIGAGGGSIARIDEGGVLKVGPESAGARPGPACYGQGGISAHRDRCEPGARPARRRDQACGPGGAAPGDC